jgi:transposase InsO family protein
MKNQFGVEIKRARTDNGTGEFTNSEWDDIVTETGIQHETSPPYHQDRNGVIERMIRTTLSTRTFFHIDPGFGFAAPKPESFQFCINILIPLMWRLFQAIGSSCAAEG